MKTEISWLIEGRVMLIAITEGLEPEGYIKLVEESYQFGLQYPNNLMHAVVDLREMGPYNMRLVDFTKASPRRHPKAGWTLLLRSQNPLIQGLLNVVVALPAQITHTRMRFVYTLQEAFQFLAEADDDVMAAWKQHPSHPTSPKLP